MHTIQAGDSCKIIETVSHDSDGTDPWKSGVNPYNLQIGMQLFICPGEGYVPPQIGRRNTGGGTGNAGSGTGNTGSGNMSGGTGSMGGKHGRRETEMPEAATRPNQSVRIPSSVSTRICVLHMVKSCLLVENVPDDCSRKTMQTSRRWKNGCLRPQTRSRMYLQGIFRSQRPDSSAIF